MMFLVAALLFTLQAFRDHIVFFYSPSDILARQPPPGRILRLGGLVEAGSLVKGDGQRIGFTITDGAQRIAVTYEGLLPNLFRESQGVVAQGMLTEAGQFRASSILAKHDETYMPREVVESLKASGRWKGGEATPP